MADDFLGSFLGNPNRARVVRIFSLNPSEVFTLPLVAKRSGANVASVAREIKVLEKLGVLKKARFTIRVGRKQVSGKQKEKAWAYDPDFKYAAALMKFVHEISPVQHKKMVEALRRGGRLSAVILSGSFLGDPTRPADLIIAAEGLNESRLEAAIRGLEPAYGREIRYAAFSTPEFRYRLTIQDRLIRDTLDYPHLVLLDRMRLLS